MGLRESRIISYFLKWLNLFLKLPKVIKNLEVENKYYYGNLRDYLEKISREVQFKIREIETKVSDLSHKVTEEGKEVLNKLADLELKSSEVVDKLKELEVKEIPKILEVDKESYLSRAISFFSFILS
ncbi:MAG: hypothetical protein KCCBMMGE_01010 [Candidatus Methanoperedenaceae archaeon GB37]|nr:MAG: hypothetical protein KCCBMMGE_01010 [Candidatus Methanoperedenaceae archaeon GB37]